jgi:hypothetical protein
VYTVLCYIDIICVIKKTDDVELFNMPRMTIFGRTICTVWRLVTSVCLSWLNGTFMQSNHDIARISNTALALSYICKQKGFTLQTVSLFVSMA